MLWLWSVLIAAAMILAALSDVGLLVVLLAASPWMAIPGGIVESHGIKIQSAWPFVIAYGGLGILLAALAVRYKNRFYMHASILILGFLAAASIAFYRVNGL